jgi:hypothetical protein
MQIIQPIVITESMVLTVTGEVPETDYSAWSSTTSYGVGQNVMRTTGVHRCYESLQNNNLNNTPESSPTWWLDIGATNRFRPFDEVTGSQATKATPMVYKIKPGVTFNSVAVINCLNTSVRFQTDSPSYDATISTGASDIVLTNLNGGAATNLTITINNTGTDPKVGEIVVGTVTSLGTFRPDPQAGISDYSVKEVDEWGNWTVTERGYAKRLDCEVSLLVSAADTVFSLLAGYRATPLVWIGTASYSTAIVYGYWKDFALAFINRNYARLRLQIEGLT